jgi:lysophospholipase L1-like esterase
MKMGKVFKAAAAALLAVSAQLAFALDNGAAKPVRVILVGDSTMATKSGYGDALCARFVAGTSCINLARGGRSSGSFRAEGRWDEVQALLRNGGAFSATYVLIQFGHNDQPGKPGRSTDLVTEFPVNMARYAQEAKALGGVPVLVTPLTRRSFAGATLKNDLAPWTASTTAVAKAEHAALLDLNALSYAAVQQMGMAEADTLAMEPPPATPPPAPAAGAQADIKAEVQGAAKSAFDRTHVGAKGAALFSRMVAKELAVVVPAIAPSLRQEN